MHRCTAPALEQYNKFKLTFNFNCVTGKVEVAGSCCLDLNIYRGDSPNRAPFFSIKMNDNVSRRDRRVPGNGSDVTPGELLLRERARHRVLGRFVYWNRLFVFKPDGTLSTRLTLLPLPISAEENDRFCFKRKYYIHISRSW